jgi:predicted nucleic acid-binding protein
MLLVDSTVWIDYFNGRRTLSTDYLDAALATQPILMGDLILAEILQGFREDSSFELASVMLGHLPQANMLNTALAVQSALNYRRLRRLGVTVRKTIDCLIATFAISAGCELLHDDRDFDPFEEYLGLQVVHLA